MRIVSGRYGGRKLNVPRGRDIRPTTDKIRGAMFNMLQSRDVVDGAHVLDGFCGSGALGLEALSRGAKSCSFWDQSRDSVNLAKSNVQMCDALGFCEFQVKNTLKCGMKPEKEAGFDLIFLDPPYHKGMVQVALSALYEGGWMNAGCWIVCESEKGCTRSNIDGFTHESEKIYGEIRIGLLHYPMTPV